MRILHVITELGLGGTQGQLATVAIGMRNAGHDVEVASLMSGGRNADRLREAGIPVTSLGARRGVPDPRALWRLKTHVSRFGPAVVQSWLYHADLVALLATRGARHTALLWNIRGSALESTGRTSAVVRLLALCSTMPLAVVANSTAGRDSHAQRGFRPRRWEVIPNAVDLALYRPAADARRSLRQELGLDPGAVLVGHVARFDPVKDHTGLLQAAALVARRQEDVHFVLVGPGVDRSNSTLTGPIRALGLESRVHLLGPRTDTPRLQAAWDIAISSSHYEGFPNALAEAMSCAVPCVGTDAGDVRYLLGDTGIVVPPGNAQSLSDAVLSLLGEGAAALVTRGLAARERVVTHFAADAVVGRYLALYRSLSGETSPLRA